MSATVDVLGVDHVQGTSDRADMTDALPCAASAAQLTRARWAIDPLRCARLNTRLAPALTKSLRRFATMRLSLGGYCRHNDGTD